jgi:hypothetical protein
MENAILIRTRYDIEENIQRGGIGWWTFSEQRVTKHCEYALIAQLRGADTSRDMVMCITKITGVQNSDEMDRRKNILFNEYGSVNKLNHYPDIRSNFIYVNAEDYVDFAKLNWLRVK